MQHKNIFLLLALSGSVLMVMLVSTLLFIPHTSSLQANITAVPTVKEPEIREAQLSDDKFYPHREPDEILKTIQQYVENNDPDAAKRLYDELYTAHPNALKQMGGEVSEEMSLKENKN